MAREGARTIGSSSSSSMPPRVRLRLVPALCRRDGICLSSKGSWLRSLSPVSILVLRASIRDIALLGLTPDIVLLSGSMLCRIVGESPLICTLGRRDTVAVDDRTIGLARPVLLSHMAIQSSVKLRQMLSALRRTCRSDVPVPRMELAEWNVPCGPALPDISANVSASNAVASSVRYTEGEMCCLALARASRSNGCILLPLGV